MGQVDTKKKLKLKEVKVEKKPTPLLRPQKKLSSKVLAKKVIKSTSKSIAENPIKTTKSKFKKTSIKKIVDANFDTQINIPSSASLRLLEKVELYKQWYEVFLPQHAATAAKIFGFAFLILGSVFVTYGHFSIKNNLLNTAALVCSDELCNKSEDVELASGAPEVIFLNTLPEILGSDNDIWVEFKNAESMDLYLISIFSGKRIKLEPAEKASDSKYRYLISEKDLSGSYLISAEIKNENKKFIFKGQSFTVNIPETEAEIVKDEVFEIVTEEDIVVSASTTSSSEDEFLISTSTSTSTTSTAISELSKTNSVLEKEVFSLSLESVEGSKYIKISTGNYTPKSVQVYATLPGSSNKILLGEATKVQDYWYLSLSAVLLPSYKMHIFAVLEQDDLEVQSVAVSYEPSKEQDKNTLKPEELSILAKKIDLSLEEIGVENEKRNNYFSNYILNNNTVDGVLNNLVERVEEIDYLALLYASSLQPNNGLFIKLARENLVNIYNTIENNSSDYNNPVINTYFTKNLNTFIDSIIENEILVSKSSSLLSERDTDLDGVSDYDEYVNFNTDPNIADTDLDGVIDSVEIVTLHNPLEFDIQNYPDIGSLVLNSFVDKEIVAINGVEKQNIKDTTGDEYYIYNLSGKAIPNTFVYVFSKNKNTVSITKTNEQGNFSIAMENQDENTPLAFEAVLVDNDGKVLVSSGEFSFSEKGNDQIATLFNGLEQEYSIRVSELKTNSILVTSLALVILGFVLILLSQFLKFKRRTYLNVGH